MSKQRLPNINSSDSLEGRLAQIRAELMAKDTFDAECEEYEEYFPGFRENWHAAKNVLPTRYDFPLAAKALGVRVEDVTRANLESKTKISARELELLARPTFDKDYEEFEKVRGPGILRPLDRDPQF